MPAVRSRRVLSIPLVALALVLGCAIAASGDAAAAKSRIARPETDAKVAPAARATATATTVTPVLDALRETAPGEYEGIVPVRMPDGSWHVALDERFMLFSVAHRAPGGGITRGCLHGPTGVAAWQASVLAKSAARPQVSAPGGTVETKWEVR